MQNLKFALWLLALCLSGRMYAQFDINTLTPCNGEKVEIHLVSDPLFFGYCENDDPANPVYENTKFYQFAAIYDQNLISLNVTQGQLNQIGTNSDLSFTHFLNGGYTSAASIQINIAGYRRRIDNGQFTLCYTQTFIIAPKKKVSIYGNTLIESPGLQTYTATNIPGVTWSWTTPPGWTHIDSTANSITLMPVPGGSTTATIAATPSQPLYGACGLPLSLNIHISGCAFNGQSSYNFCIPQTNWTGAFRSFEYGDPDKFPRMMGDFNGDGKQDLIGFGNEQVAVGLSTGQFFNVSTWTTAFTYGAAGGWKQSLHPRYVGDFDGDGKDDIVGFGQDYTTVALSTGSAFSLSGFTPTTALSNAQGFTGSHLPRKIGDFNGDGKADIIGFGHSSVTVGISTGSSFDISGWGASSFGDVNFTNENTCPRMLGDFNGDGRTDIIGFGETEVFVGISTGSSFNVSTWTTDFTNTLHNGIHQDLTPRGIADFNGDGKDDIILVGQQEIWVALSTGYSFGYANIWLRDAFSWTSPELNNPISTRPMILCTDINIDGKDDLVGFSDEGTFISYSTGSFFECPDHSSRMACNGNDARFAGNFDNTDDMPEIVACDDPSVSVINCKYCTSSVASAVVSGHYDMETETGYQQWELDVYKFCSNTLWVDVSGTLCEDSYFIAVKEFDLNTWTTGPTIYDSGWITGNAPDYFLNLDTLDLVPGKLYRVEFGVGPDWNLTAFGVRITNPDAGFNLNPNETRTISGPAQTTYTINGFCKNVITTSLNGAAASCYDEYRYDVYQVIPPFMYTTGTAVQQIPAGGGWLSGPAVAQNIALNNFGTGKIYAIRMQVRRNGITSTFVRYAEKSDCVIGTDPGPLQPAFTSGTNNHGSESKLYPNPARNQVTVALADFETPLVNGSIYDAYGKCIRNLELGNQASHTLDVSGLSPGLYFMILQGKGRNEKISFVKQ